MNNNPLVSIVIPSYKSMYFENSLRSAIGQTYNNIEILVFDNCPNDEIKDICGKYPQVNYLRNYDVGASNNVLKSIYENNGDYVKPLFDDDILHPFCVQRMVEKSVSLNSPLTFSSSAVIDRNNCKTLIRRPFDKDCMISGNSMHKIMTLNFTNFIGEFSTILLSKNKLKELNKNSLFEIDNVSFTRGLADVATYINISHNESIIYIDEELSYFRKDSSIESNSNPYTNTEFVYAITDWIYLMIKSCDLNVISKEEIRVKMDMVLNFLDGWSKYHPSVEATKVKFIEYME